MQPFGAKRTYLRNLCDILLCFVKHDQFVFTTKLVNFETLMLLTKYRLLWDYWIMVEQPLGDTYLKIWMTEFFEDFFFSAVGGWIKKKHPHPHQGTEGVKKKQLFIDWKNPLPNRLWELKYYLTRLVSLLLWHCGIVPGTWKGLLYRG